MLGQHDVRVVLLEDRVVLEVTFDVVLSGLEDERWSLESDSIESSSDEGGRSECSRDAKGDNEEPHVSEERHELRAGLVRRFERFVLKDSVDGEEEARELLRQLGNGLLTLSSARG